MKTIKYRYTITDHRGFGKEMIAGEVSGTGSVEIKIPRLSLGGTIRVSWEVENGNDSNSELESDKT